MLIHTHVNELMCMFLNYCVHVAACMYMCVCVHWSVCAVFVVLKNCFKPL